MALSPAAMESIKNGFRSAVPAAKAIIPAVGAAVATWGIVEWIRPKPSKLTKFREGTMVLVKDGNEIISFLKNIVLVRDAFLGASEGTTQMTEERFNAAVMAEVDLRFAQAKELDKRVNEAIAKERGELYAEKAAATALLEQEKTALAAEKASLDARIKASVDAAIAAHEAAKVVAHQHEPSAKITRKPQLKKTAGT